MSEQQFFFKCVFLFNEVLHRYNESQIAEQKYETTYDKNRQHHINISHHGSRKGCHSLSKEHSRLHSFSPLV